jgi:hypothetical protein
MTAPATNHERSSPSFVMMSRWRRWLFNRIARWEEDSLARSLGLPAEHFFLVDLSADDGDREL